ncbi:MAG: S8 family serine peptidase, partial [Clostridia bacterium]|nr:S8 family serine peptidase [Clostridia bacterium]
MKRLLACLLAALMLLSLLPVLPASAEEAAPCDALQYTVLLVPRAGEALTAAAARAGMAADDFALTPAGQEVLTAADARLAALEAAATEACHCLTVENRFRVSMLGLAVSVDITDLPELRALGDTSPEDTAFDLHLPASYAPLLAERTDAAPADLPTAPLPSSTAGEGSVIAILDTGFSPDESFFTLPDGTASVLQGDALAARLAMIGKTVEGASAKIPFLYNYAEPGAAIDTQAAHGTEVAALAAANAKGDFAGGAPAAQLLCMKVFGETDALADELTLIAAIEDALLLGADVINISLGQPDGGATGGSGLALALAGAERAGVSVICAAGNNAETGEGSIFIGTTGQNLFPTAYPDRGLTAAPASFAGSFSVGAALGSYFTLPMLLDGSGRKIVYSDSCGDFFTDPQYSGMATDFLHLMQYAAGGSSFAYVAVPGVGAADDYAGLDLRGKAALVERGTISFVEKTQHAAAAGAIAVIIYDNDPESNGSLNMELTDAKLPAVIISVADGQRLAAAGSGTLSFPDDRTSPRGQHVTDVTAFSSRGMRDDYTLSPNLVAPGQNFLGLTAGGGVTLLTGTSYAAAQMSGATAALLTRIRTQGLADGTDAAQLAEVLLQNTAMPIMTDGVPVTVRAQGAGLLNPADAMRTPIALTGNDGGAVTATGAEQSFSLTFTLRNLTDQPRTAQLIPSALADVYAQPDLSAVENRDAVERLLAAYGWDELPLCTTGRLRALPDTVFSFDGARIGEGGLALTLAAGEVRTLTVEVSLADADADAYAEAFPNGFAVEGRFALRVEDGDAHHVLTLPWAVFCGDRADTPIAPVLAYDEGEKLYYGQVMTVRTITGDTIKLGVLPEAEEDVAPYSDI